jgi:uncharacterized protein (DUF2062 family)
VTWGSWLDEYDREARLVPALLVLVPVVLAAVGLGFENNPLLAAVIGILFAVGAPMLVAKQVANRGRDLEKSLFSGWGGPPTTLKLVPPADAPLGEIRKQRRDRLERATGITLPTSSTLTLTDAETYQAAVHWLITNTRDHARFPVVWTELKSYGFERNLLGLRSLGLASSATSVMALAAGLIAGVLGAEVTLAPLAILCAVCVAIGLAWWFGSNEQRVRVVADRYAERLLDATNAPIRS